MPALPLLVVLLATAQADDLSADACASLIPPALANRLAADLPNYRLPTSADAGARLKDIANQGDWPCPFVVIGDFDGNGWLDRALLLPAKGEGNARLVTVSNLQGQWQLSLNEEWPLPLSSSELRPLEAGLYQRADATLQPAAMLDQLASLQADFSALRAGQSGGEYRVYALVNGHWQKLSMPAQ
jgi:hypothetical protein